MKAAQCLGLETGKAWRILEPLTTAFGSFLGFRSAIAAEEGRWCRAGESLSTGFWKALGLSQPRSQGWLI